MDREEQNGRFPTSKAAESVLVGWLRHAAQRTAASGCAVASAGVYTLKLLLHVPSVDEHRTHFQCNSSLSWRTQGGAREPRFGEEPLACVRYEELTTESTADGTECAV